MDSQSFDQLTIPEEGVADALRWIRPSDEIDVLFIDAGPTDIQLPSAVELQVGDTDPGIKGDTASGGGTKPATLETGAVVQVPLFVDDRGERGAGGHPVGRVRLARVASRMRLSEQRRAAVVALYQHDVTGRPVDDALPARRPSLHAGARAREWPSTARKPTP